MKLKLSNKLDLRRDIFGGLMKIIFLLLTVTLSIQTYAHEKGKKNDHHNTRHHKINLDLSLIPYFKQDQKKCETPCTVTFDASKSKAIGKSKIKYFHFDFGDGEKITSRDPVVTHTYLTSPSGRKKYFKISLQLENDKGRLSLTKSSKVKVASSGVDSNLPPISDFSYLPNVPDVNEIILLKSLSSDDTGISSYEWFISDGRSFNGQTVGVHFTAPGVYTVIHRVTDLQGLISESMLQITVKSAMKYFKDGLIKQLEGLDINKFNPIDLQVRMTLNESLIKMSEELFITINDSSLPIENIIFEGNTLLFNLKAKEGRNSVEVSGIGIDGHLTSDAFEFYSGSKNVNFRTLNSAENGTLKVYPFEESSFKQEFKTQNGYIVLENVPKENIVFESVSNFGSAVRVLHRIESDIDIEMIPFSPLSHIDNNDFATGLDGWEVQGGIPERSYKVSQGQEVYEDFDLSVSTDETNHVIIQRSFNSNVSNNFITVEYNYVSLMDDEYLVATLFNKTTGLLKTEFMSGKHQKYDLRNVSPHSYLISVFSNNPTDIIHFTLERVPAEQISLSPMLNRSMISPLNTTSRQGGVEIVKTDTRRRFSFEAYTRTFDRLNGVYQVDRKLFDGNMEYISVGPHNTSAKYTTPILNEYSIHLDVHGIEGDTKLLITQPTSNVVATSLAQVSESVGNIRTNNVPITLKQFSFDYSEIAAFNNHSELILRLEITDVEGKVHSEVLSRRLKPLTDYNATRVYGIRDPQMGGEFWAQAHTVKALDKIFSIKSDFRGFAINDISMLHSGYFSGHPSGHLNGDKVDYYTDHMSSTNEANQLVLSSRAIEDISYLLKRSNSWPHIKSIFLTFKKLGILSKENKIIRGRCTADNRLYKDVFINKDHHVTHGHLNFKDNLTPPISIQSFGNFRPFFKQTLTSPRTFKFKVPLDVNFDMTFIWEIRFEGNLIEVIDELTPIHLPGNVVGASGALLERSPGQHSITYTFPDAGYKYEVNLVAVRSIDQESRCLEQTISLYPSFSVNQEDSEIESLDLYCDNEWQTFRGRDFVDPISQGKKLLGAVVSDLVEFNAGRFYVANDEASFCGKSVIKDNFPDFSGCPSGQSNELCASIVIKGPVDSYQSTLDATEGKILIAGDGRLNGAPAIPQSIPNRYFPEEEEATIDNSYIKAKNGESIIIERSEIDNSKIEGSAIIQYSIVGKNSQIKDRVLIQKSIVENSEIMDTSKILGAYVLALEGSFEKPQILISGNSEISGLLSTLSKVVISNSRVTADSSISGAGKFIDSYLEGFIIADDVDPNVFDSVRVATIDNSFLLKDCILAGRVHLLNESIAGNHSSYPSSKNCNLLENVTVKDGAWVGNGSIVFGSPVIEGDRVLLINASVADEASINSKIGGTLEAMLINEGGIYQNAKVFGTPQLIKSGAGKDAVIQDNIVMINSGAYSSTIRENAYLEDSVFGSYYDSSNNLIEGNAKLINSNVFGSNNTIRDNSLIVNSSIYGESSMSGEAQLSHVRIMHQTIDAGLVSLSGTASAQSCDFLRAGSYSLGDFVPDENGYCTTSGIVIPLAQRAISSTTDDQSISDIFDRSITKSAELKNNIGERKKKLLSGLLSNHRKTKRKSLRIAYQGLASSLNDKMNESIKRDAFRRINSVDLKKIKFEKEQMKNKYQKK